MLFTVIVLFCMISLTPEASEVGLGGKVLLFPTKTNSSYVKLFPKKPMRMSAFTLCMRVATEEPMKKEMIFFTYRTPNVDEINVWRENDGRTALYIKTSKDAAFFTLPPFTLRTHMCTTWSSASGFTAFWVNGQRSGHQVYRKGFIINHDGTVLLGQDADYYLGKFDAKQSFVGEISDVNMWDYVLSGNQIRALNSKQHGVPNGNVFDWNAIQYEKYGNVKVGQDN
ncbi:pentraxin fusion protein-like [Myxocyprinus asiaticus]|uniref:pentraxin fusion protein-like n=1 Tax=Myxocyprinus asiaticus TaxID=70543 RepID=UPI0022216CD9|nr:pentraxin fusion protein-like [Myxocyprinus asiaticus]